MIVSTFLASAVADTLVLRDELFAAKFQPKGFLDFKATYI